MNLMMRPRVTDAHPPRPVPAVVLGPPGNIFDKRRYTRAQVSAMRRGTLLVGLALLALIFLAARGSPIVP
jgi:hypothetical protein